MPNWVEGTLKVRGKIENLAKFVESALEPVLAYGENGGVLKAELWHNDAQTGFTAALNGETELCCDLYLKDTKRNFINMEGMEISASVYDEDINNKKAVLLLPFRAAWQIYIEPLLDLCKEYGVDMSIVGFERGTEFVRDIKIVHGMIVKNNQIEYEDWAWECPCPLAGG